MIIEILYPEICNLFGDIGNIQYLQHCLPDAEFVPTTFGTEPLFATETPDFIYMGTASEKNQEKIIAMLSPYRVRLKELLETGVPMLFTGNAGEILFDYIENWDGRKIPGLGIVPFTAKRSQYTRYNGLTLATFHDQFDTLGFRSQFTYWYGDNSSCPFVSCKKGIGMNPESSLEGIHLHNTIITAQLGPILVNNPKLTRHVLDSMGAVDAPVAFEKEIQAAYDVRMQEFLNPKIKFSI
ncbi:MAG: hypothetical protein IJ315_09810 [Firmicutes bacterium]|nr:hypothetical protein [Bacillota bacterium]